MKVILRINGDILTGKCFIPDECLNTEYKVPFNKKASTHAINRAQDIMREDKILIFKWDGRSRYRKSETSAPIMDLVEVL